MEATGVKIDKSLLDSLTIEFYQQGIALETEIFEILGYKFNLNSPKEMGNILFEQLAINIDGKPAKKSKNGSYSTNADILKGLHYNDKPIGDMILKYRTINKLISTYTKALPQQINAETGRVHTNFSNAKVITGRISSNNPNLQNIPNSNILGNKIRSAFIAKEGHVLISADYSQIELRLLAELADIDSLQTAFKNNQDIHAITASEIFEVPLEEVTSNLRSKAKAINFGIIYGISSFGLAQQLDISRSDAKKYITHYLETYQGISDFIEKCKIKAKQDNKIVTLFNRECHIKNINSSNKIHQSFAERLAVNATIQGSAADIIKKAMLSLFNALNDNKLQSKIILQIHDELILEVPNNEIEFVQKLTKDTMENVVNLSVPLTVKCNVGNNWSEL